MLSHLHASDPDIVGPIAPDNLPVNGNAVICPRFRNHNMIIAGIIPCAVDGAGGAAGVIHFHTVLVPFVGQFAARAAEHMRFERDAVTCGELYRCGITRIVRAVFRLVVNRREEKITAYGNICIVECPNNIVVVTQKILFQALFAPNIFAQPECRAPVSAADKRAVTDGQACFRLVRTGKSAAAAIASGKGSAVYSQLAFMKIYSVPAAVTGVPSFKTAAVDGYRAAFYNNGFGQISATP